MFTYTQAKCFMKIFIKYLPVLIPRHLILHILLVREVATKSALASRLAIRDKGYSNRDHFYRPP